MADVLRVKPLARMKLKKNGTTVYDQAYVPTEEAYTEHTGDRVVLSTNQTVMQEVNLGGVSTGDKLLLITNKTINVALNSTAVPWSVGNCLLVDGGSFTHLYVQNESATVEATVEFIVTD